jgi:hypothetical protein
VNTQQVLDTPLKPSESVMALINAGETAMLVAQGAEVLKWDHAAGDTKVIWDRANADEVEGARRQFDFMKSKGYMAYKAIGEKGTKGDVLHAFDPAAERVIFAPPLRGGRWPR